MWPFITDVPSAVQMIMLISCVLMGLSHLLQPQIWSTFFAHLVERGTFGLVTNQFLNSAPGAIIVALHQVWTGPAIVLTLYGWLLLLKAVIALVIAPSLGMRSLKMSRHGDNAFRIAGVVLLGVGVACGLALAGVGMPAT
jgi:uncharacterized protein YjeT (DUF2065 family)